MTKTGADFAYWNTNPDGSGTFYGWPLVAPLVMPGANLTLYAQWLATTGLNNGGATDHYAFFYDSSLQAGGALIKAAEADFGIMSGWFAGITPSGPLPIPVYVTRLNGGANNTGAIRLGNPNSTRFGANPVTDFGSRFDYVESACLDLIASERMEARQ